MILGSNLAFDCADARRVASFWLAAIGYEMEDATDEEYAAALAMHPEWSGLAVVDEEQHRHPRLFLQTVPEPKVERNRIRPVVATDSVGRLLALGAREGDDGLLLDVESNELRVVPCGDGITRFAAIEIDATDPDVQSAFWSEALGFVRDGPSCHPREDWCRRMPCYPSLSFVPAAAPKLHKNRLHFDFISDDPDADHDRLLALGARDVAPHPGFVTMQDLEGNEFDFTLSAVGSR